MLDAQAEVQHRSLHKPIRISRLLLKLDQRLDYRA